jgi:hypothetical protein
MRVFVPLTDRLLYEHPEEIHGPVVPFSPEYECLHWLDIERLDDSTANEATHEETLLYEA